MRWAPPDCLASDGVAIHSQCETPFQPLSRKLQMVKGGGVGARRGEGGALILHVEERDGGVEDFIVVLQPMKEQPFQE